MKEKKVGRKELESLPTMNWRFEQGYLDVLLAYPGRPLDKIKMCAMISDVMIYKIMSERKRMETDQYYRMSKVIILLCVVFMIGWQWLSGSTVATRRSGNGIAMSTKERTSHQREINLDNIPAELKALPNWVCYRIEERYGQSKPTKVPYDPRTGEHAKANDPATWTDYETCTAALQRGEYDGIGFEFGSGYVGIDLDHCRDPETGEIVEWASDVIAHMDSYSEASPSQTGAHIILRGTLPAGRRRMGPIEMYDQARYFTITGAHIDGTPGSVEERSVELKELHDALYKDDEATENAAESPSLPNPEANTANDLSDAEIIERASKAANGAKFRDLWAGDWHGQYTSQSEADEALCWNLAFWAGRDADRIDTLFRQSGLYRKKWDRQDYRQGTIARAIKNTAKTYQISRRERIERLYAGLAAQRSRPAVETELSLAPTPNQAPSVEKNESDFSDFRYGQTDLGLSERFIRQHGEDLRYCVEMAMWLKWNGTRWEPDKLKQVHQLAKKTAKALYFELAAEPDEEKRKQLFKFIQKSESERSLNAVVNLARTDPRIAVSISAFDTQPHLLNCKNCTIDLRTGELLPHRREDLLSKQCPTIFDPNAKSEVWERFLNDCTRGDKELQGFLQRAVGYTLYGDPREQIMFLVHGPAATGKSTFTAAVMAVMADYAMTTDFTTFVKKDRISNGPSDAIADLAGARLVASVEVEDGAQLAQSLVKTLTGGDMVRARHLYQSSFEFRPQFALWVVCNQAPVISQDDAIWRRLLRLPFENVIPKDKRNKNLRNLLTDPQTVGPAILKWAVDGCVEWYRNGLQVPDTVQQATDAYKQESNPLANFVDDCCVLARNVCTAVADVRRAYDEWRRESGEIDTLTRNQFTAAMRDLGCIAEIKNRNRVWSGIALRDDDNNSYTAFRGKRTLSGATSANSLKEKRNESSFFDV
ncbi:MAG: phage/plasmid primase, P4 family [Bryobacteraceae bacterium]